jgi:type I restriction enzyme S subunit
MSFETATLDSLCELVVDCPHSTPKWTDEGIIVLRNQNIKNGVLDLSAPSFTNEEDYQKRIKRAAPKAGDIVFTREAPMGEVCMIPEGLKCCLGQRQVLLRPKSDVNGQYLFWALQSPYVQQQIAWNEGTGSTVSNVRIPVLKALNIPRIGNEDMVAKSLSDIASKMALNTQTNQTLEQMAQAIFKSWFVDFDPVKAKMNGELPEGMDAATASLFPEKLVESEFGLIPEGWEAKPLGDYLTIKRGGYPRPIKDFIVPEGYPWTKIADATANDNPYIFKTKEFIKEEGLKKTVYLKKGTLILSNSATPGLPRFLELDACIHDGWLHFPEKKYFTDSYLYQLFLHIRKHLVAQGNGSVFTNLKTDILRNQVVLVPPKELVDIYEKHASKFLETVKTKSIESNQLAQLRDTLLPKLLSGEIELGQAQELAEVE